jgi:hypothetical protein
MQANDVQMKATTKRCMVQSIAGIPYEFEFSIGTNDKYAAKHRNLYEITSH